MMITSDPTSITSDGRRTSKGQHVWYVGSDTNQPVHVAGDYLTVNADGELIVWVAGEITQVCLAGYWKCFFPLGDRLKLQTYNGCFNGVEVPEGHQHDIPGLDD